MSTATDADLIALALGGRREAFGTLVTRYESAVCAVAFSRLGNAAASEDVAQETFLIAWRKLGDVARTPAKLAPWLCGIARNVARGRRRKEAREVPDAGLDDRVGDRPASALDALIGREAEALVWGALAEIPERYREPLVLHYRCGKSIREVARALDLTEDAAKQRLSRGRKLLRAEVEQITTRVLEEGKPSKRVLAGVMAALPVGARPTTGTAKAGLGLGTSGALVAGLGVVIAAAVVAMPPSFEDTPSSPAAVAAATSEKRSEPAATSVPSPAKGSAFVRWLSRLEARRIEAARRVRSDGVDREPSRGRSVPIDLEVREAPLKDLMMLFGDVIEEPILVDAALADDPVTLEGAGTAAIELLDDALAQSGARREDIEAMVLLEGGDVDASDLGDARIDATFAQTPLPEVFARIEPLLDVPIHYAPPRDQDPITITAAFEDVPVGTVMTRVLEEADLGFELRPGLLVVPIEVEGQ